MRQIITKTSPGESRTPEQLHDHYLVERELAEVLKQSGQTDRLKLYGEVYNDLFRRVPNHPQLTRVSSTSTIETIVKEKMALLSRFLTPETTFLEVGAGDCRLAMEAAKYVRQVYAIDVSDEVNKDVTAPANFNLILSNGTDIPTPPECVTVAYSYQLIEHVHPEDAAVQLRNIYRALAPGGTYICITPNRLTGPHDISKYFDREATGLHLKEYTISELARLFRRCGFDSVYAYPGAGGKFARVRVAPVTIFESSVAMLPWALRRWVAQIPLVANVLLSAVIAVKGESDKRSK